jgi:hypothetical protein
LACLLVAAVLYASDNQVRLVAVYGQPVAFAPLVTKESGVAMVDNRCHMAWRGLSHRWLCLPTYHAAALDGVQAFNTVLEWI